MSKLLDNNSETIEKNDNLEITKKKRGRKPKVLKNNDSEISNQVIEENLINHNKQKKKKKNYRKIKYR